MYLPAFDRVDSLAIAQINGWPSVRKKTMMDMGKTQTTVKPVCNDHLYNKICYVWFIQ